MKHNPISLNEIDTDHPLPADMMNRPDAAELRAFLRNFRNITSVDDKRMILEAVRLAAEGNS